MSETEALGSNETQRGEGEEGFPHGSKAPLVLATGIFGVFLGFIFPIEWVVGVPIFAAGLYLWLHEYSVVEYERGVIPEQKRQLLGAPSALVAAVFVIVSEVLVFGGAFVAWFFLQSQQGPWPPRGLPALHPVSGFLETLVLFVGAVLLFWSRRGIQHGARSRLSLGILTPVVAGLVYLGLVAYDWTSLMAAGLQPTSGAYGAAYYYLSGLHAAHVIVGLLLLVFLGYRYWARGHFDEHRYTMVRVTEAYWWFLTGVSAVIFFLVALPLST